MSRIIFFFFFLLPFISVQNNAQTTESSIEDSTDADDEFYKIMDDFQHDLEELSPDDIVQFDMEPNTQEVIQIKF